MQPSLEIEQGRSLAPLSTFGIGGPADRFVVVRSIEEMQMAMQLPGPHLVVGKGSNCLFDDGGFRGLVILNKIDFFEELGAGRFRVGAGFGFPLVGIRTAKRGWSGLEFASGIPGTVGGAVVMNAGAGGQETADVLESVETVDCEGQVHPIPREEIAFAYRTSPFQSGEVAVAAATFQLEPSEEARARQLAEVARRKETQPLWEKSAGCMFRNPEGASAGRLIEECGLKGLAVGEAVISDLHANFIVNRGGASSADVRALIEQVQQRVYEKTGHQLREEVRYLGGRE